MHSSNPVFTRSEGFNGRSTTATTSGVSYPAYGTPQAGGQGGGPAYGSPTHTDPTVDRGRMTIDSVVQKTGVTLGLLILSAAATWAFLPETYFRFAMIAALLGMGLGLFVSFRRAISPALVVAYALIQGVFLGAISNVFNNMYPGIVVNAIGGTLIAFAGTLAAYKFFNIQVTPKFRKFVVAASFSFVGLILLDFGLSFFGLDFGWNGYGAIGLISSVIGLVLGVFMLILDFDYIEEGVRVGLPEQESWRAAFGLTVTLVWIYIEILRILAILRGD